jgi:high affinity Mn2+ porin
MIKRLLPVILWILPLLAVAQTAPDSLNAGQKFNFHFQNTIIYQYHPSFNAKYTGAYSLLPEAEKHISASATFFLGIKLWKHGSFYINPELSGGSGFSETRGIAGFPNGEVYRVDNPAPKIYLARGYFNQVMPLSGTEVDVEDDMNQLGGKMPEAYLSFTAGKFSILDFFDQNSYSHEPRTQFYNWALMGNGAYDYPANTRGYTYGFVEELVYPGWALRFASVMVPTTANGSVMDLNILKAHSSAMEYEKKFNLFKRKGTVRLLGYLTRANMGNYQKAIEWGTANSTTPEVDSVNVTGNTKYGFGLNIEYDPSPNIGWFLRAGWNDGHNESWAFTEIDMALSTGFQLAGTIWNRAEDRIGIAFLMNGISKDHREYLKKGGNGFIIGDGNLNYGSETIAEIYYSFRLGSYPLWLSPDYQFILHPAYNKDRGPVHAFGIRILTAL